MIHYDIFFIIYVLWCLGFYAVRVSLNLTVQEGRSNWISWQSWLRWEVEVYHGYYKKSYSREMISKLAAIVAKRSETDSYPSQQMTL